MTMTAIRISAAATARNFARWAPIAYLRSIHPRMKLMFIDQELVDLRADLLLCQPGTDAWWSIERNIRSHEAASSQTRRRIIEITGHMVEMNSIEAAAVGLIAGMLGATAVSFVCAQLVGVLR